MPLKELFKREQIKTIAAESAGRSFYDLLLSCVCVSSSLESYKAQGVYLTARNSPHCTTGLRCLCSLLLHAKVQSHKRNIGKRGKENIGDSSYSKSTLCPRIFLDTCTYLYLLSRSIIYVCKYLSIYLSIYLFNLIQIFKHLTD